jgi:dTDP-3-amino-2,3,6-trideoxy-4-keto-D-glucose/dTDP-3-amino-3,4,6-trideoxy-alpha-D-glucose/dTDP-2,6-dideoxy-D-kanosamine transaminase
MKNTNFLTKQYLHNKKFNISHNYLSKQFSDYKKIFKKIEKLIKFNDYTLGFEVEKFEKKFAKLINAKHCIGVGSGTDAIYLALKALGLKNNDEVITTPYTFYATINAIVQADCRPNFVDSGKDFNINPDLIEKSITKKTKAILVVHWSGRICDMKKINQIAKKYKLFVIEDACHAALAFKKNKYAGNFGDIGCFSLHPLKNLNVWGDGGMIITNDTKINKKLKLIRNHGLINRNNIEVFGVNSRLDTLQAIVANHLLPKLKNITMARIKNANYLDNNLKYINQIYIPEREKNSREVFHLYCVQAKKRDKLVRFLMSKGIDAKKHYPIPMHLQKPSKQMFGYKKGDFPMAEKLSDETLSLPVHEFITKKQLDFVIDQINFFYSKKINS